MFGSIRAYIIAAVIITGMCGGFYWYYSTSQAKIAQLIENSAKLEVAIQQNEQTIAVMRQDNAALQRTTEQLNVALGETRQQNQLLVAKLNEHNLGYLSSSKPQLIENLINSGTRKATRCFELMSGSSLTVAEKDAKNAKDFNSECPWLYSPRQ